MKKYLIVYSDGSIEDFGLEKLSKLRNSNMSFYFLPIREGNIFQLYDLDNIQKPDKKDSKELIKLLQELKK